MKGRKTGGRMQGVPNRTTHEIKLSLQKLLDANIDQMEADLLQLPAKERLTILLKIADYIIPKVQATQPDDSESVYNQNKSVQKFLENRRINGL